MEQASNPVNSMDATFLLQQPSVENGITLENGVTVDAFSRQLLFAMKSFRDGNFSVRLPQDLTGVEGKIADAFKASTAYFPLQIVAKSKSRLPPGGYRQGSLARPRLGRVHLPVPSIAGTTESAKSQPVSASDASPCTRFLRYCFGLPPVMSRYLLDKTEERPKDNRTESEAS